MRRFDWNALRPGDEVLIHDDEHTLLLVPGVVAAVDDRSGFNEVAFRLGDVDGRVVRPRRRAVHTTPVDRRDPCWRCDAVLREAKPT